MEEIEKNTPSWKNNLRCLMAERGFNPRSLSLKAGLNSCAVRDILAGRSRYPRYDTVEALAKALSITPSVLMESQIKSSGVVAS